MLIGNGKLLQKLRDQQTNQPNKQVFLPLPDCGAISNNLHHLTNKNIDKYPLQCMIVELHSFIASATSLPPLLNLPHYSHLPNWIKRLLDVSQRGFIVSVCDSHV